MHEASSLGALVEATSAVVASLDVSGVRCAISLGTLATEDAAQTKVGLSTQGAKDVANVVGGLNAGSKGAVPAGEDTLDDFDTSKVNVLHGRSEATLVVDQKVVVGGSVLRRAVKVRGYLCLVSTHMN